MNSWINEEIIVLVAFLGFFILLGKKLLIGIKSFLEGYRTKIQEELDDVRTLNSSAAHTHANKEKELENTDKALKNLHNEERQAMTRRWQTFMDDITRQKQQKEADISNHVGREKTEALTRWQERFINETMRASRNTIEKTIKQTHHDMLIHQSIEKIAKERR